MSKKKDKDNSEELKSTENQSATSTAGDAETPEFEMQPDPAEALRAELAAEKDRYLRLAAEYDNYRKRSQKERDAIFSDVKADTVTKILPIYDNLSRALAIPCADEAFYKGVEMTMNQVLDAFNKLGIKKIPAAGEKFNPDLHNAVVHVEDEALGESVIVEEFQAGFTIGDKVIRFSMVKVAN
jgi:molecular chaperone GrpE